MGADTAIQSLSEAAGWLESSTCPFLKVGAHNLDVF